MTQNIINETASNGGNFRIKFLASKIVFLIIGSRLFIDEF